MNYKITASCFVGPSKSPEIFPLESITHINQFFTKWTTKNCFCLIPETPDGFIPTWDKSWRCTLSRSQNDLGDGYTKKITKAFTNHNTSTILDIHLYKKQQIRNLIVAKEIKKTLSHPRN